MKELYIEKFLQQVHRKLNEQGMLEENQCVFLKCGQVEKISYDVQSVVFSYEEDVRNTDKIAVKAIEQKSILVNDNIEHIDDEFEVFPDKSINSAFNS